MAETILNGYSTNIINVGQVAFGYEPGQELVAPPHYFETFLAATPMAPLTTGILCIVLSF